MTDVSERKKARQDEVYGAAARLFAERGYHATRVQDIADELGMLKGSLYYYFSSKEDLLVQVIEGYVEEIYEALVGIVNSGYSPRQKLILALDAHLRLFHQNAHVYAIFMQENLTMIDRATAVTVKQRNKAYAHLWEQILEQGVQQGDFRPGLDIPVTARAILGMCNHTLTWYQVDGRLPIRELARVFSQLILQGIESE